MAKKKLSLLLVVSFVCAAAAKIPPSCSKIECPKYTVVQHGRDFEIRKYDSPVWVTTSPIQDDSFTIATNDGFVKLFSYIGGRNAERKRIEMTAPVLTETLSSGAPNQNPLYNVSFYVPKVVQPNLPKADGLHAEKWTSTYAAVKQFGGFVTDGDVAKHAAALKASLKGTKWGAAVEKSATSSYFVAQYNAPFEFLDRVNEIWFTFVDTKVYDV